MKFLKQCGVVAVSAAISIYSLKAAPVFVGSFGSSGTAVGQFDAPWGVAVAPNGTVYVGDEGNDRVEFFTPSGVVLGAFGAPGVGPGLFDGPYYPAVSLDGTRVYVGDFDNDRVEIFSPNGGYLGEFAVAGSANALSEFTTGNVYVSDYNGDRMLVYSQSGAFLGAFGTGILSDPEGFAQSTDGTFLAVADYGNDRLVFFTVDGAVGGAFGIAGTGPGQFNGPTGVAISGSGILYVVDNGNDRVQYFTEAGVYLGEFGSTGSGPGQLSDPEGIAVAANGLIYVVENSNDRVSIFVDSAAVTLPAVTPKDKKKKIKTTKKKFNLRGAATAGRGTLVGSVMVKVGKKKARLAKGTDAWSYRVRLKERKTKVKIFALDQLGQQSSVTRKVIELKPKKKAS